VETYIRKKLYEKCHRKFRIQVQFPSISVASNQAYLGIEGSHFQHQLQYVVSYILCYVQKCKAMKLAVRLG
jgi:hypothetical protein